MHQKIKSILMERVYMIFKNSLDMYGRKDINFRITTINLLNTFKKLKKNITIKF